MSNSNFKHKAFISYKHSDKGRMHAIALEKGLKSYAKPLLKPPVSIFRDEKHMVPDNDLSRLIQNGLEQSEFLIFLADQDSAGSTWCQDELIYWCEELGRSDNLIIIHIGGDIVTNVEKKAIDWKKTNAIPSILSKYITSIPLYVNLFWAEHASDLVLEHAQYRSVINLITAKLRYVTPEHLDDEALKTYRRNQALRNAALVVLSILLLVSIGTAIYARDQQIRAIDAREEAIKAQKLAETRLEEVRLANAQEDRQKYNRLLERARDLKPLYPLSACELYHEADSIRDRHKDMEPFKEQEERIATLLKECEKYN